MTTTNRERRESAFENYLASEQRLFDIVYGDDAQAGEVE